MGRGPWSSASSPQDGYNITDTDVGEHDSDASGGDLYWVNEQGRHDYSYDQDNGIGEEDWLSFQLVMAPFLLFSLALIIAFWTTNNRRLRQRLLQVCVKDGRMEGWKYKDDDDPSVMG